MNEKFIIFDYTPTLKDVQELVDGPVEALELTNGDLMVFNEEGKLRGFDINVHATTHFTFFHPSKSVQDVIVGNAGVIPKELRGEGW